MPIRTKLEQPKTEGRQRWAITMLAGLDLEATLGIPPQVSDLAATTSEAFAAGASGNVAGLGTLKPVGTVQSLDLGQNRTITQRMGFNANPLQPFQTVPHGSLFTLKLSRVVLKKLPEVEASFQFLPSNLLLQQLPFVLDITDVGDIDDPSTYIRHVIYGCWFSDSAVKYDVTSTDDTRLIQSVTITPGRVLTFDPSFGGNPTVQAASAGLGAIFSTLQDSDSARNLLEDFELS